MKAAAELNRWRRSAIPFWLERSWDRSRGGFYESVDLEGNPLTREARRVRVQARQVYSFAMLDSLGWAESLSMAEEGWAYVVANARHGDGGFVHRLTADGSVQSTVRDLYDHAFLLLAAATLWDVTKNTNYRDDCVEIVDFLDREMGHPEIGYVESIGGAVSPRRQNPHMHLFEALMVYHKAGGQGALEKASEIKQIFASRFYSAEAKKLYEYYGDGLDSSLPLDGEVAEPGHLAEWVWLLDQFAVLSGQELDPAARALFECVLDQGVNPATGLLYASQNASGDPLAQESRTWMQTEWFRAAAVAHRHGFKHSERALEMASEGLMIRHFSGVPCGGWQDRIEADGRPSMDRMPASTLYHVIGALIEADKMLDSGPC